MQICEPETIWGAAHPQLSAGTDALAAFRLLKYEAEAAAAPGEEATTAGPHGEKKPLKVNKNIGFDVFSSTNKSTIHLENLL